MDSDHLYRTQWRPLPDITAWELAVDRQYVNGSEIVAARDFAALGSALRHRVCDAWDKEARRLISRRMDEIAREKDQSNG